MSDNIKRFTLRVPDDVYSKLEDLAEKNRRSINSQVVTILEQHLENLEVLQQSNDN